MSGALPRLRAEAAHLTPALARLAADILARPEAVVYESITELADAARVGEASVVRLCRDLGFKGFQDFKLALAADLALRPQPGGAEDGLPDLLARVTQEAVAALQETRAALAPGALEAALEALLAAPELLIYGAGASGVSAQDFAYKFLRLGYRVSAPSDAHLAAMAAATLPAGAALVALTRSGSTLDTLEVMRLARARGAATLLVSQRLRSPAAALADITLRTASAESPLTGGSIPSKMGQLLVLDLLFAALLRRRAGAPGALAATAQAVTDRNV